MTRLGVLRLASAREMFEGFSFSEPAREVVELAQDEARSLEHNWVGSEHLLLALGRAEEGVAAGVLGDLGIVPERVRDVVASGGARPQVTSAKLRFTPRANMVLSLALRETLAFGDSFVGTAHILLALTRVSEGRAARIMFDLGVDPGEVGGEVLAVRHAQDGSWRSGAWDEPMAAGSTPGATGGPEPLRATAVRAAVEVAMWAAADHARLPPMALPAARAPQRDRTAARPPRRRHATGRTGRTARQRRLAAPAIRELETRQPQAAR